ncbi:histidine kinase [Planomonospora parontospora subsp. parontospora]|uniref:histidine kinase n=2 Tax=Planomonospora parontospora TaxID=58119 RepID=A0AA37F6C7_9ACTN|nr:SpoIIE family protein phosphatase [Planomonospora parontospora]GGK81199.1 histidine kinase [Planomonospora parontospora]GII11790.1 histidine kinase [Planomonospora parontospora subsp. parontospora]
MTRCDDAERGSPGAAGAAVFAADEEVGRDLAGVDWRKTPLGPPDGWPQSLRTAVSILLSSRFPMWMAWGPELTFFCNAAYRRDTLGQKYPWALGRPADEVWAEIWDDIGPRIGTVLATGEATWDEALLLFLERAGYPEETYHTFSYSPLRDDDGAVVGMLCVVSEDTERVIGERRMATLRDLGSDPSVVRTEQEMLAFACRQLGRNRHDLPFTLTYLFDDDGRARLAGTTGIPAGHPAAPADLAFDDPDGVWPAAALARGESVLVSLGGARFTGLPSGNWPEPPAQAVVVPLLQQGSAPYGFLVAALNRYRPLDRGYQGFIELAAGHVAAGIASARSYQAQQRRAEELAELDRAKTVFFSNISHEFRTPLTLIMGPVQELRSRLRDADAQVHEELEIVHRNGLRLGKLVNTLLDFSRIEAGRMQARYEPVDLAAVTAELASVFRSAIDKAGLAFEVDCPPLAEPAYIDRNMWEKVVLNLLSNALKFTFDGSIGVRLRHRDGHAVVTVADTGIGVPADELPRLFERFHRIESARSRSNEGSGIGLALVKELVGLHGGTITADSVEGKGTTFTIRLPLGSGHLPADGLVPTGAAEPGSATADPFVEEALRWLPADGTAPRETAALGVSATASSPAPDGGAPARVLIADDNADMRDYLARLLRQSYQVTLVNDGQAALEAVRADPPDLLVSDVMMPRLDGLQLVAALRADPRTAGVPVLLLSARAGQEASIEGLEAGADDYLVKPFSAAELLARVRANIELARMRNHHARWRSAMIESLQEAFFVADESGAVVEINAAFADILGYGPEGLPYTPLHPWWPDEAEDPQAHAMVGEAFAQLVSEGRGSCVIPVTHRDGHQVWVAVTFNDVTDPDTGRRRVVGTMRDVTAEHYLVQRESALAALSMRISQAGSLSDTLSGALEELRDVWHARRVLAVLWQEDAERPVLTVPGSAGLRWQDLPEDLRERITELRGHPPLRPLADEAGGAGITLEHPGGLLAVWIDLDQMRPFTAEDQTLLALLTGRLGQGLHRAHQLDQQREAAVALQRAILGPSRLPDGFAVRYEPATRPLEVGGDWYDIVPLSGDRIAVVVGDCVGRGLEAAAVMGQLRSACRALLLQDAGPAQVLGALDRFAALVPGAKCTTVFCGVLDTATGELVYSSAGHPPGILAHPDGTTLLLEGGRSTPLAVRPGHPRPEAECTMPARSTLLLYTDGLVERRRRPLTAGIDQAGAAVQDGRSTPIEDLATHVMTRLAPDSGFNDDVALVLYRQPAPLEVAFPAESGQLAPVRTALRDWLSRCELNPSMIQNVLVAAGEACANAIEHGHRHAPGHMIRLRAVATARDLRLTVADTGRWKPPQPEANPHRGRGVALMRALMHHVTIEPGAAGTTVDMHARITR